MMERSVFWAQALDNSSPDHIYMHGEPLSPSDSARRQEAVSLVSGVVKTGVRVFESHGMSLTADEGHFVVEILSAQRDQAGRTAPLVCYGKYDSTMTASFGALVAGDLNDFAERIGRSLQPGHFELARESFVVLKKKLLRKKLVRVLGIAAAFLVLLLVAYYLLASRAP